MDTTRICARIADIPPGRNPNLYAEPARVLYKRPGLATGWMRPHVYFDGNPMNLSGPLDKEWADSYIATPFPGIYELVLCDKAGVPLDKKLREKYFEWVKQTYSIDLASLYVDAVPEAVLDGPPLSDADRSDDPDAPIEPNHQKDSAPHGSDGAAETAPPAADSIAAEPVSAEPGKRKRR